MKTTCTSIDRRLLLGLLAGCTCGSALPIPASARTKPAPKSLTDVKGCRVPDQFSSFLTDRGLVLGSMAGAKAGAAAETKLVRTTGDPQMDVALDRALYRIAETFRIFPGFGFYDDGDAPNAFAMSRALVQGTDGTVAFGQNYFRKWLSYDPSGVAIIATAAHEFAHVWLFKSGRYDAVNAGQSTVRRSELHADFLAGFYLGLRKKDNPTASFWAAGDKFRQIGDYETRDRDHHGTPTERVAAAEAGFKLSFVEGRGAAEAFQVGIGYVTGV